jgi:hypothetical protein
MILRIHNTVCNSNKAEEKELLGGTGGGGGGVGEGYDLVGVLLPLLLPVGGEGHAPGPPPSPPPRAWGGSTVLNAENTRGINK